MKNFILIILFLLITSFSIKAENIDNNYIFTYNYIFKVKLKENSYQILKKAKLKGIIDAVRIGNFLYIATKKFVYKYSLNLKQISFIGYRKIESIATDNKYIYISADNFFITLSKDLDQLSRLDLKCTPIISKNAHDILLYKNRAYLLDNIMMPMYIFVIDIHNPENLKLIAKSEIKGLNPHLYAQTIYKDKWYIIQTYSHMGGWGQNLHIYNVNLFFKSKIINLFEYIRRKNESKGIFIQAIKKMNPYYIVGTFDNKVYLYKADFEKLYFYDRVQLPLIEPYKKVKIYKLKDNLIIISQKAIYIYNTKKGKITNTIKENYYYLKGGIF